MAAVHFNTSNDDEIHKPPTLSLARARALSLSAPFSQTLKLTPNKTAVEDSTDVGIVAGHVLAVPYAQ